MTIANNNNNNNTLSMTWKNSAISSFILIRSKMRRPGLHIWSRKD